MRRGNHGRGALLFGVTGWLFADLFVALAMGFLVANTVGQVLPATPTPVRAHSGPTATATILPTATPLPALNLTPITLNLTVDYQGLLNHNAGTIAQIEGQVRGDARLKGKRAGLVLSFGGASFGTNLAIQVANGCDTAVLQDLGRQNYVFIDTVYRDFFTLDADPSSLQIDVYVFKS
ncbi:MAG: hypothetical protein ACRDHE_10330 [Ktedonobacterales bacterium]